LSQFIMSSMLCILSETIYSVGKYDKKIYYCSREMLVMN